MVEDPKDILTIEETNAYNGLYHVLKGTISPIDGIGPKDLTIDKLKTRLENKEIKEVILATNPTIEGDTTAMYIQNILKEYDVKVSRLALGLPVGIVYGTAALRRLGPDGVVGSS